MTYSLAQINVAKMLDAIDSPVMREFAEALDSMNALAEASPGFVWRFKTDEGNATSVRVFDDEYIIVNVSVWESVEALYQYVYYSDHTAFFRRRMEWFDKMPVMHMALWWIPAGHPPTLEEAKTKLELIEREGATPLAFTFKERFTVEDMLEAERAAQRG
jgi:hypothetical protein